MGCEDRNPGLSPNPDPQDPLTWPQHGILGTAAVALLSIYKNVLSVSDVSSSIETPGSPFTPTAALDKALPSHLSPSSNLPLLPPTKTGWVHTLLPFASLPSGSLTFIPASCCCQKVFPAEALRSPLLCGSHVAWLPPALLSPVSPPDPAGDML